jgi:hypothetical protein
LFNHAFNSSSLSPDAAFVTFELYRAFSNIGNRKKKREQLSRPNFTAPD